MKSLRQLLRRRQHSTNAERSPKRRGSRRPSSSAKRRLITQALEQRQLLAGDLNDAHNYWNGYDVNQDMQISPSDALTVINYLAASEVSGTSRALGEQVDNPASNLFAGRKVDVNDDGAVTPSDALTVINALASGETLDPLAKYYLTARDADDNLLPENNGVVEVGVGRENSFFLEVAYDDLRDNDLGAFSIFPDIGVSQGGILKPVLREAQQVIIDGSYRDATSGSITVGLEGSSETVNITLQEILDDEFDDRVEDALINTFGYSSNDFRLTEPEAINADDDVGVQIKYTADEFGNVDLPNLTFTPNFDVSVPVDFREFAPFEADGVTPNSDAVRFNLDVRSRTYNIEIGNFEIDNVEFYTALNRGTYDLNTGFTDIGGVGQASPGGIPAVDADRDLEEPFDAFRIEVFVDQPVASMVVDVNPGEGVDPLTLYGSNDVVPDDLIIIDNDSRVTLSTGAVQNNPPVLGTSPLTTTVSEDDSDTSFDLLTDASDPDAGDTLSVQAGSFTIDSGDASGVTLNGNNLDITPSAYNSLMAGEDEEVVATYNVTDGTANVAQTITVTITGENDAPVVGDNITFETTENDSPSNVSLLQNVTDPDGDSLSVTGVTVRAGSDDASGITINEAENRLEISPNAYDSLNDGDTVTVTYDFNVTDGNGGSEPHVAIITITGISDDPNEDPVVSSPVTASASEDDADFQVDLLAGASDPDEDDVLSVASLDIDGVPGLTLDGNTLNVSPSAYNFLAEGEQELIELTYNVVDGRGGSVAQSATITITGVNDAPVVSGPVLEELSEDDPTTDVDLLGNASDPDTNDVLGIENLAYQSGDDSGVTLNSDSLSVDPTAYNNLAVGESADIVYTYDVTDGNGGVVSTSATITITGVNDAPTVGAPITESYSEDDAADSVDLLAGATDPDTNDSLSVSDFSVDSGDDTGISLSGNTLTVTPSAYNSLAADDVETISISYNIVDGNGGSVAQTATITINGENDAPVVNAPLQFTFNEDQAAQTVSLLDGASDPDTGDTLSVINVQVTGDQSGITQNGSSVEIDPRAYGAALASGEQEVITFTYDVSDGDATVSQTATITIEGRDESIPTVNGPITESFNERDPQTFVDLLAGADDADDDPLSVINATVTSGDARGVTIDAANNRLEVTPSAYLDLDDGETAEIVVSYQITDDQDNTVDQTATITIIGETVQPSTISGQLWIDRVENIDDVLNGAAPERNGVQESDEDALGGVLVRLLQVSGEGETEIATVRTDAQGNYTFTDVLPGTYFVEYDIPESVQFTGSNRGQVVIGEFGGVEATGPSLNAIGLSGVYHRLDLLAKTYIAMNDYSGQLSGGSVQLNADGTQRMFIAEDGFDVEFAEVVLNDARDAALLTIIDSENNVRTTRLSAEQFVVTGNGDGVRFFGNLEDFEFGSTSDEVLRQEFDDYRKAIDEVMGAI
jgi:VCBS repeat-containing protein